jgi:hypothetical protein
MAAARYQPNLPATKNAIGVPIKKLGKIPMNAPSANPNPVFAGVEFSRTMRITCRRTQRAKRRERETGTGGRAGWVVVFSFVKLESSLSIGRPGNSDSCTGREISHFPMNFG